MSRWASRLGWLGALLLSTLQVPALADDVKTLKQTQQALQEKQAQEAQLREQAKALAQEVETLRQQRIAVTANIQAQEQRIDRLETQNIQLRQTLEARQEALIAREHDLAAVLSAFARAPITPSRFIFLFPGTPQDAARSALLLQSAIPALQQRAAALRRALEELTQLRSVLGEQLREEARARDDLRTRSARLKTLEARKTAISQGVDQEQQQVRARVAALAVRVQSLTALIEQVEQERRRAAAQARRAGKDSLPEAVRAFPRSGGLKPPVAGQLVRRYGEALEHGATSRGVTTRTQPGAQVSAPYDGRVAFIGPFRDHGLIIILEHRGDYHTVLTGFERAQTETGRWILAGEPVGTMRRQADGGHPILYLELRHKGRPVDPLNWIDVAKGVGKPK